MSRKPGVSKKRPSFPPMIKDNPKITPGRVPKDKSAAESKKKVIYDRVIVFDFVPLANGNYVYSLSKAQTEMSGFTDKELNEDILRLSNREKKRSLNIFDPPHSHLLVAKVDARKYRLSDYCLIYVHCPALFVHKVCPTFGCEQLSPGSMFRSGPSWPLIPGLSWTRHARLSVHGLDTSSMARTM